MKLVSIVILNWNGMQYLERFLPALITHTIHPDAEIVVADNGSEDGSLAFIKKTFPGIRTIELDRNYGFSGGYNRALEQVDARYAILLNSDIEVTEGWLEPMLELMEHDEMVAACSPRIMDYHRRSYFEYAGAAGGFMDRYGYPFCRGRIFDHLEEDNGQYDDPADLFWGSGACLMVRVDAFRKAGGLDERFFAHMEEIDLCWRLQRMGYRIRFVPHATVYHVGGATLNRKDPFKTYLNFRNNLLLLYKNLPVRGRNRILFFRMILDGISALRFLIGGDMKDFRAVFRAHRAYYGMKSSYRGIKNRSKYPENSVIVSGIFPGSIVIEFFLKGKRRFDELDQKFRR
jgi:GT2 family glycosyltransferase